MTSDLLPLLYPLLKQTKWICSNVRMQLHFNIPLVIGELGVEPESMRCQSQNLFIGQSQPKDLVSVFSELRGQDWVLLGQAIGT